MKKKIFNNFKEFSVHLSKIKNSNKKIVLCHGVFDLYHAGHLNYFEEAKKNADVLIVSITSDKFVKKAPNRPYFQFNERAKVISSIKLIDYVIKSDFETSIEIIKFLKPHIYFKGPDYKDNKKDLTGNIKREIQAVKKFNGNVIYSEGKTFSSSRILNTFNEYNKLQKKTIDYIKTNYSYDYIKKNVFDKLSKENVLVVGDTIIDKFIFTKNLGISGKEAIRTVEKIKEKKLVGGAIAVANTVSNFVKKVDLITAMGENKNDQNFCKRNLNSNIKLKKITLKGVPTTEKSKIVDITTNLKLLGLYNFNDNELSSINNIKLNKLFKKSLKNKKIGIFLDYGHGLFNKKFSKLILSNKNKNFYFNTQINAANFGYHTIGKYKSAKYAVINEVELRHEMRDRVSKIDNLIKLMAKKLNIKVLVVTAGTQGSFAYSKKIDKVFHCPSFAKNVVDKIGAGDNFMSIFSLISNFSKNDLMLPLFIASLSTIDVLSGYGNQKNTKLNNLKKRLVYILK